MANSDEVQPTSDGMEHGETGDQLGEISKLFEENAQLRSRNRKVALFGVLIVFLILSLFTLRLIGIFTDYRKYFDGIRQEGWRDALKNEDVPLSSYQVGRGPEIEAAIKEVAREGESTIVPAFQRVQKKISQKILPDFSERVLKRFGQREKEFSKLCNEMMENLKTHAQTQVKSELMRVMVQSADGVSDDIRKSFPELDDRRIEKELTDSQAYFYDKLHDLGTTKIARFDPVLRGLRGQIDGMTKGKKITPEMREQVTNEFLEGLFDRVKYEFVPGLGEQKVNPPATGKAKIGGKQ